MQIKLVFLFALLFQGSILISAQTNEQLVQLKKGELLLVANEPEAEKILVGLSELPENQENYYAKGKAYRLLAHISASHSRKSEQIEQLFKSYWFFDQTNNNAEITEAQRLIGYYYFQMKLADQADDFLARAYQRAITHKDTLAQIKIISNQAQLLGMQNFQEEALRLYQQAILMSKKANYKQGLCENWNRLSYVYWKSGQADKMLACMKEAIRYKPANIDTVGILYGDLGLAYLQAHKLDLADYYLQQSLKLIKQGSNTQQQLIITRFLFDLREAQNRLPEAIRYLKQHDSLRQYVFTKELKSEVSYAEVKYKQLATTKQLQAVSEKENRLLIALALGVSLLILMAFIILWLRKNNRIIQSQNTKIDSALTNLTEKEKLLRQLFDSSPCLILTHTLEGAILSTNQVVQQTFQLTDDELKDRSIVEFIPQVFHHYFSNYFSKLRQQGASSGWIRIVDYKGTTRMLRYQSKVMISAKAEPYVIGFAIDDTDSFNSRVEADLERRRLRTVMDNSPDIFSILKNDGTITFMNRSNSPSVNDVVGKNILQLLSPERGNQFFQNLEYVFKNQTFFQSEEIFEDKVYLTKLVPIISNNKVNEVLSINTDVTEIKKREERERLLNRKVERSELRYRQLVEESMVLISSHDLEGTLVSINKPAMKSLGYRPEEMVGRNLQTFVSEEFRDDFPNYLHQMKTVGTFEGFLSINTKNGERRVFLCRNVLLKEEGIVLGSAQDVTEWKKSEQRERKVKQELERAKDEAEESNRLKTIFLGSLSHEVRTPLQGILGFAEILENTDLPQHKRVEYLNIIKRRTIDMQNIIESLLDLASLESGEIKPFPVETNLHGFADMMLERVLQDPSLARKSIQVLNYNTLRADAFARIDPQHLLQVVTNIVRNAIKFTNEGSVSIKYEEQKDVYLISVTDTGIGISADKIDHIFKPFRQAHEGISRSKGGIGLGLSICHKMVEMWQGTITVHSTLGKGSTFSFTIPKTMSLS
jgi:PAS domain S-box-containing protein